MLPRSFHQRQLARQRDNAARAEFLRRQRETAQRRNEAEAGEQGGAWNPPGNGEERAPSDGRRSPAWPDKSKQIVSGQARDVRYDKIPHWFIGGRQVPSVSFRVELFDDRADQVFVVSVAMAGDGVDGFVRDGDGVRVGGRFRDGILHAREIRNHTSNSTLRSSRGGGVLERVVTALGIALVLLIAAGVFAGFFGWRPPFFRQDGRPPFFTEGFCPPPQFPARPPWCP